MSRRRILAVLAALALIPLGVAVYRSESYGASEDPCRSDLGAIFERCDRDHEGSPCRMVADDLVEACQAGCVMFTCPEQITCTSLDPIWCSAPCSDPRGARYWYDLSMAEARCVYKDEEGLGPWNNCLLADMRAQCPELKSWKQWPGRE